MKLQRHGFAAGLLATALLLAACGGDDDSTDTGGGGDQQELSGAVKVDGSSTVAPLTTAAAELFAEEQPKVRVTVGTSGTGGGFEKFCNGETDISDASRPIKDEEKAACEAKSIEYEELTVANDALTVVVNKDNNWAECLTVDQLKKIWEPELEGQQLEPGRPEVPERAAEALRRRAPTPAPSTTSPTRSTVRRAPAAPTTAVRGRQRHRARACPAPRAAWATSASPTTRRTRTSSRRVEVDGGEGCVEPSVETVQDGTYKPLARPLFIYPTVKALKRPEVAGLRRVLRRATTARSPRTRSSCR